MGAERKKETTSEVPKEFWKKAELHIPKKKEVMTIRVDSEVLSWFRGRGRGYQSFINSVLKSYVEAAKENSAPADQKRDEER